MRHKLAPIILAGLIAASHAVAADVKSNPTRGSASHVVQPGDTLWDIARQRLSSAGRWPELKSLNRIATPELLAPGQVIQLERRQASPLWMTVRELTGQAWLTRDGTQGPLLVGSPLRVGDLVVTDHESFLCVAMSDGSRMILPSSSALRIEQSSSTRVLFQLLKGRVESYIAKQHARRFEIRARTAAVGVRGTHFRVQDDGSAPTAEVVEGAVDVSKPSAGANDSLRLAGGFGTLLSESRSLNAVPLLPPPTEIGDLVERRIAGGRVAGADAYRLQMGRDEGLSNLVFENRSPTPSFELPDSVQPGFYHLKMTAIDASGIEGMPAQAAVYVGPIADTSVRARVQPDRSVMLSWPAVQGADFVVEVALDPDFSAKIARQEIQTHAALIAALASAGTYYWRIRAASDAPGVYRHTASFIIPD